MSKVALKAVVSEALIAAPSVLTFDMAANVLPSVWRINNLSLKRARSLVIALSWRFFLFIFLLHVDLHQK